MASASGLINANLLGSFACSNGYSPAGGPRVVVLPLDFSVGTLSNDGFTKSLSLNITELIQLDKLDFVQSLFINNRLNNDVFEIKLPITQQRLSVPPQSQAYLSALCADSGKLEFITGADYNGFVYVHLLNVPVANCVWKT